MNYLNRHEDYVTRNGIVKEVGWRTCVSRAMFYRRLRIETPRNFLKTSRLRLTFLSF